MELSSLLTEVHHGLISVGMDAHSARLELIARILGRHPLDEDALQAELGIDTVEGIMVSARLRRDEAVLCALINAELQRMKNQFKLSYAQASSEIIRRITSPSSNMMTNQSESTRRIHRNAGKKNNWAGDKGLDAKKKANARREHPDTEQTAMERIQAKKRRKNHAKNGP